MLTHIKEFLFRNQTIRQTVAKNTFWLTVSNFGGRFLRSTIIIYAARVLGAGQWGIFSYALSLIAFITLFSDIGIGSILVREIAQGRENQNRYKQVLSTALFLKLALMTLGVIMVLFVAPHLTKIPEVKLILPIVVFIFAFDTMREFGFSLIRGLEKMEWEAFLYLLTNLAIVICGFIFLYIASSVQSMTYAYTLGTGIGCAATIFVLRKKLSGVFSNFSAGIMMSILRAAWPFAIAGALGMLMLNADILIIGWMRSSEDVGLYSAAQRIIQLLYLLPAVLSVSLLPAFARFARKDNEKFRIILEMILHFAFLLAIPIAIGGLLFSREIMTFVFGGSYAPASLSFALLSLTLLIDFPAVILSNAVFAFNKQKKLTIYAAIGGILNIILDLILIPIFGITGSAIATLAAQFVSNIYLRHIVKKEVNFSIVKHLKRVLVATALMATVCVALNMAGVHVLIVIASGMVVYGGALLLLKEPILKEIKFILQPTASENVPIVS